MGRVHATGSTHDAMGSIPYLLVVLMVLMVGYMLLAVMASLLGWGTLPVSSAHDAVGRVHVLNTVLY